LAEGVKNNNNKEYQVVRFFLDPPMVRGHFALNNLSSTMDPKKVNPLVIGKNNPIIDEPPTSCKKE